METSKDKLKKLTASSEDPILSDAEIDELLAGSAAADASGLGPQSEAWTPTYDVNSAAAEGWLIKAARSASTTETDPDSLEITSRVFENCLRMAKLYSKKRAVSVMTI